MERNSSCEFTDQPVASTLEAGRKFGYQVRRETLACLLGRVWKVLSRAVVQEDEHFRQVPLLGMRERMR